MAKRTKENLLLTLIKGKKRKTISILAVFIYLIATIFFLESEVVVLPEDNAPIQFYANQLKHDVRKTLKEAILQAKSSIHIAIFSLTDQEIIDALHKKAEEGVDIQIIHDSVGTPALDFRLGPKVKLYPRRFKGLMHNKILVIDRAQVWLGSANFTKESLLMHGNLVIGIQSPGLAQAAEQKLEALKSYHVVKISPHILRTNTQNLDLHFLPDSTEAIKDLLSVIQTAKKTLRVAMFTFTHPTLIQAVIQAQKRGVDVQVVFDSQSSKQTSLKAFTRLKKEGVKTYVRSIPGLLHYKMLIADNTILVKGSANWTKAAFTQNDENIFFLKPLTLEQQNFLNTLWNKIVQEAK